MLDAFFGVIALLGSVSIWLHIVAGTLVGVLFGIIPGLNALVAIPLFMPIIFAMEPLSGVVFIIAMATTTNNAGLVTAALLNVPGTENNIAAMTDSYAMTRRGEANKALGLGLVGTLLGGLLGGVVLLASIPIIAPIVMAFASPEILVLVLVGVAFIAILSEDKLKGLMAGCMGFMLSFVGISSVTGDVRFIFGSMRLMDGFRLPPIALGLFALPTVINLFCQKPQAAGQAAAAGQIVSAGKIVKEGVTGVLRNLSMFARAVMVGVFLGFVPAVGGPAATFMMYGIAKKSAKRPEEFGKGSDEAIIAVESMICGKDAGGLIPVLAFGIPGTLTAALIMASFIVLGMQPGPIMFRDNLDVVMTLPIVIIIANTLASGGLIFTARYITRVTNVKTAGLPPILLVTCLCGAFLARSAWFDVGAFFVFGIVGCLMVKFGYSRAPLILGLILGSATERFMFLTLRIYGWTFFLQRPIVMGLLIFIVACAVISRVSKVYKARKARTAQ